MAYMWSYPGKADGVLLLCSPVRSILISPNMAMPRNNHCHLFSIYFLPDQFNKEGVCKPGDSCSEEVNPYPSLHSKKLSSNTSSEYRGVSYHGAAD